MLLSTHLKPNLRPAQASHTQAFGIVGASREAHSDPSHGQHMQVLTPRSIEQSHGSAKAEVLWFGYRQRSGLLFEETTLLSPNLRDLWQTCESYDLNPRDSSNS